MQEQSPLPAGFEHLFNDKLKPVFIYSNESAPLPLATVREHILQLNQGMAEGDLPIGRHVVYEDELELIQECAEISTVKELSVGYGMESLSATYQAGTAFAEELMTTSPETFLAWANFMRVTSMDSAQDRGLLGAIGIEINHTATNQHHLDVYASSWQQLTKDKLGENYNLLMEQTGFVIGFRSKILRTFGQFARNALPINNLMPALGIDRTDEHPHAIVAENIDILTTVIQKIAYLNGLISRSFFEDNDGNYNLINRMRDVTRDIRTGMTNMWEGIVNPELFKLIMQIPKEHELRIADEAYVLAEGAGHYFEEKIASATLDNPFFRIMSLGRYLFDLDDLENENLGIRYEDNLFNLQIIDNALANPDAFWDEEYGFFAWSQYLEGETGKPLGYSVHDLIHRIQDQYNRQMGYNDETGVYVTPTGLSEFNERRSYDIPLDPAARVSHVMGKLNQYYYINLYQRDWERMGIDDYFSQSLIVAREILDDDELQLFLQQIKDDVSTRTHFLNTRERDLQLARRYMYESYGWSDLFHPDTNRFNLDSFLAELPFWENNPLSRAREMHKWERIRRFAYFHRLFTAEEYPIFEALTLDLEQF